MALFPLPVKAEMTDTFALPTQKLQFGSGVFQLAKSGLQRPIEVWNVEVAYPDLATGLVLDNFLGSVKQSKIFQWQSPRDLSPQNYRITGDVGGTVRNGGGRLPVFFTRSMRFKRYYG